MTQEQSKNMSQYFYRASAEDFMKIPGSPVAYWMKDELRAAFERSKLLGNLAEVKHGLSTGKNSEVVRLWYEISICDFGPNLTSPELAAQTSKKWFPYNKGGDYRKWYGNCEYVLRYDQRGKDLMTSFSGHRHDGKSHYFLEGVTWTFISSSNFAARYTPPGFIFDVSGSSLFVKNPKFTTAYLCSQLCYEILKALNPTLNFQVGNLKSLPILEKALEELSPHITESSERAISLSAQDWDEYETSWCFTTNPLLESNSASGTIKEKYTYKCQSWSDRIDEMRQLEENNNRVFNQAYGLDDKLTPDVPLEEITLTCNPHYRYGGNRNEEELETLLQCDTLRELVSYAIGCMMGRYSLDKPGLILASQGETLQDYLQQIPSPRFAPDSDAILPLTDQEWFADDATNRYREFVRVVWGDGHLQENLDFVAESLCLHAIKSKRGESALDTIRRYLSTQFFKDHLRTYKKRPIYWLFSSGKHKAFECLVYLHRYNEGTLARMRTEYVIPLSAKLNSYAEKLEQDRDASTSAAETKRLSNELSTLHKQQAELAEFDEKLRHYADQRISLDLDDGVKVNYGKFGDLLAEVKSVNGKDE